jgi:AcrR family transcriptional regulator
MANKNISTDVAAMKGGKPENARPGSTAPARIGRRQRKDRTRQLLIDAAVDIVRQGGIEALTTTRLAGAAGITQPGFYVHFENVEHCLQAAAEQLCERFLDLQRQARQLAGSLISGPDALGKQEVIFSVFEQTLALAISKRRLVEVLLRHRHESSSAIGRSMGKALDRTRRDIADDLGRAARRMGFPEPLQKRSELVADIVLWLFLGALEALLQGRYPEREAFVAELARVTRSVFVAGMAGDSA